MQEYPKWKYHATNPPVVVANAQQEAALGPDWVDAPGRPASIKQKRRKVTNDNAE